MWWGWFWQLSLWLAADNSLRWDPWGAGSLGQLMRREMPLQPGPSSSPLIFVAAWVPDQPQMLLASCPNKRALGVPWGQGRAVDGKEVGPSHLISSLSPGVLEDLRACWDFCINIYQGYWSSFLYYLCLHLSNRVTRTAWDKFGSVLSSWTFWEDLRRIGVNSELFERVHQRSHLALGSSLLGILIKESASLLSRSDFLLLHVSVSVICVFLGIYLNFSQDST